jgi:penicillin-binding protein 2
MIPDKYRIKRIENDELKPEETLADSLSDLSPIETPISRNIFGLVYILIVLGCSFLIFKAFQLQIIRGGNFVAAIEKNTSSEYSAPALRGIIYDADSKPLVENIPIFDLVVVNAELPKVQADLDKTISDLSPVISVSKDDLDKILDENKESAFFFLKKGLSKEEMAKINLLGLKGIYVIADSERQYLGGNSFSDLLGYTSRVSQDNMDQDNYYLPTDKIGKLGLEQYYEDDLRGEHRNIILNSTTSGTASDNSDPQTQPGDNLYLNIDSAMQKQLYQTILNVITPAGLSRAAAIVQDPKTGAVLALVSLPSFDSNIFENPSESENGSKITDILGDKNQPLFDRVVSGRYSSGSTIKPLLAMAGLKEGVVTPETKVDAEGSISVRSKYDPSVVYTFKDWKIHGIVDLRQAIANSVDVYFYSLGGGYGNISGLGDEKIISYFRQMLMDKQMGIDLPGENTGFVPDEAWKLKTTGTPWYIGDTYNISIGQGGMGVTPLWLNTYVGSIANGGTMMKPFVVKEIKDNNGKVIQENQPQVLEQIPFDQKTIQVVQEGMRLAVTDGTARLLNDLPQPVAAKTGTAQITGTGYNSLFITYGPYDNPQISMTILVENVLNEGYAIRIAHDFYQWYFANLSKS